MIKRNQVNRFKTPAGNAWLKETLIQQYDTYFEKGFFSKIATLDQNEFCGSYLIRLLKVLEVIPLEYLDKKIKVLDVGCGEGQLLLILKKIGFDVCGIDKYAFMKRINTEGKDVGMQLKRFLADNAIDVKEIDVERDKIPYANDSFDLVICNAVIEHLHNSPKLVMQEMKRVLKPSGHLIVNVPNYASLGCRINMLRGRSNYGNLEKFYYEKETIDNKFIGHSRLYTVSDLKEIFHWERFKIIHCEMYSPHAKKLRYLPLYWLQRKGTGMGMILERLVKKFRDEILIIGQKP
ncbi:MAG: class I SAM-dependent methyltransferase [Candidatus Omnitrophota bacterium]